MSDNVIRDVVIQNVQHSGIGNWDRLDLERMRTGDKPLNVIHIVGSEDLHQYISHIVRLFNNWQK